MAAHIAEFVLPEGLLVAGTKNGGSPDEEDTVAAQLAEQFGYPGSGGSDVHIVNHIGRNATGFLAEIHSQAGLFEALRAEAFEASSRS